MKYCLIFIIFISFCSHASTMQDSDIEYDLTKIKQNSSLWNNTFVTRDIEKLLTILSKDVQMASAGGKCNTQKGIRNFLSSLFRCRSDVSWINNPVDIVINPQWEVAYEIGKWVESWTEPDGRATINGKYFSLWKKEQDNWLLHTITFVPLDCSGESKYCESDIEKQSTLRGEG